MKNEKINVTFFSKSEKSNRQIFCSQKSLFFSDMITRTILAMQKYKSIDIISASDLNISIRNLESLYCSLNQLKAVLELNKKVNFDEVIGKLQHINNELSAIFRSYGTEKLDDLIAVAMGVDYHRTLLASEIYEILRRYVHPIGYKALPWKEDRGTKKKKGNVLAKNRIVEDYMIVETSRDFDCFDLARTSHHFQKKVYGIKVAFHSPTEKKTIILIGLVDDVLVECTSHPFLLRKGEALRRERPKDPDFHTKDFRRFISALTIKELLIYSNSELYQRFMGYLNQVKLIKQKPIAQNVKEFISSELYGQRRTLIQLLIKDSDPEFQYLAYLLYDLLSNDTNGSIDTQEQTILFDSLPWNIKKFFRDAMKTTINYTKVLSNFDNSQIPLEQRICLLRAPDNVKEKAMLKLKEVKAKSEDSGSKARQYLDGLLKIPFDIYRKEEVLSLMGIIKEKFKTVVDTIQRYKITPGIPMKESYSSMEIAKYLDYIKETTVRTIKESNIKKLASLFTAGRRDTLAANTCYINSVIKRRNMKNVRLCHSGKKSAFMREQIRAFILSNMDENSIMDELQKRFPKGPDFSSHRSLCDIVSSIESQTKRVTDEIDTIGRRLDESIHGHKEAKRQIQRIIGQWITGKQTGYCFGFEGPPGVGKTSLAKKGLAHCLCTNAGECRPFALIALGGSSNGSTLCGHNYTYVGSTWGRICDILMEKKCMNPIIFIDELDKVSRSDRGKEIIGILTHLIDSTQNSSFQDNYFSGIDLDLSKALFIFSYNDPGAIDKILLDRIHRIKFDTLSIEEKLVIGQRYILPEIYEAVGLQDCLHFSKETLKFIIESYTHEAGVRKLKEILFEIVSEINLEILQNKNLDWTIPLDITKELVTKKYLSERHEVRHGKIHSKPAIGLITGLWANSLGRGGILPIECICSMAANPLELKLTGLQGDVMKESMEVAKTLAWKLTPRDRQAAIVKEFSKTKIQGLHVHCPEGATPKDGPSAGTAITIAIYSIFNRKKIKNNIAITGEINLQGEVTMIGGLSIKFVGGIRAGVEEFIYPAHNRPDFDKFFKKYADKITLDGIKFHPVTTIEEVLELVFV